MKTFEDLPFVRMTLYDHCQTKDWRTVVDHLYVPSLDIKLKPLNPQEIQRAYKLENAILLLRYTGTSVYFEKYSLTGGYFADGTMSSGSKITV